MKRSHGVEEPVDASGKRTRRPPATTTNASAGHKLTERALSAGEHGQSSKERCDEPYTKTYTALYEFVRALECPLCSQLMTKPSTFSTCGHTFCFDCVIETLEGKGIRWPGCPTCKQPGCRKDLQTNHLVGNAVSQVRRMMEDLARAKVAERRRLAQIGQYETIKSVDKSDHSRKMDEAGAVVRAHDHPGEAEGDDEAENIEGIENVSVGAIVGYKASISMGVDIGDAGRGDDVQTLEQTEVQGLASLASPVLLEYGELEVEVELIRAGLEWADKMPITRGSNSVNEATPSPSGRNSQLVVRQDSQLEHSVVPDSQGSEPGDAGASKRVLKEREQNVPDGGSREVMQKGTKGHAFATSDPVREAHGADRGACSDTMQHAKASPPPNTKQQTTVKKSLVAWWKEKHRRADGPGDRKRMRIVVDARTIADDPTVITLVEKFEAKYRDMVTMEDEITEHTTHFVVSMDARSVTKLTVEYLEACAVGCWVIAPSWLEDSLQHSVDIVQEKYYAAQGHARDDGTTHLGLPENSRIRAIAGKKVFSGQYFVLSPGANRTDQLMRLVEFAGGTFCDIDESGSPVAGESQMATQSSQKKMTCVVDSKLLSAMTSREKERLAALQESGRVAVVNERWLYASVEKGQAQLRNDGFYQL